jgi:DNA repair photolyase
MAKKRLSGTREWAQKSYNCSEGCSHGCLYCYARKTYIDRGGDPASWTTERPNEAADGLSVQSKDCTVMFPTQHDITPNNLEQCVKAIRGLLKGNDKLLIVSKPHYGCISRICQEFKKEGVEEKRILFRFTIGAFTDETLNFWEPGAPGFDERLQCLIHAYRAGFQTSVSCEPLLEPWHVEKMVFCFRDYVTDAIWIGKMNRIDDRVAITDYRVENVVATIEKCQTEQAVRDIYEKFKDDPKIKWKESYAQALGLPQSETPS